MSAKTYSDKWTCPKGHVNRTTRRVASIGKKVSTTCLHKDCHWKKYPIVAGPMKSMDKADA